MDVLFIPIPLRITPDTYNSLRLKFFISVNGNISCTFEKYLKSTGI